MFLGLKLTFFAHDLTENESMLRIWDFIFCMEKKTELKNRKTRIRQKSEESNSLLKTDECDKLVQTGVVEAIIVAGILYKLGKKGLPREYSLRCQFYKDVKWNDFTRIEIEEILKEAVRIYDDYWNRKNRNLDKESNLND